MTLERTLPWIALFIGTLIYGGLLVVLALRRRWSDAPERRLGSYLALVLLTNIALAGVYAAGLQSDFGSRMMRVYLYASFAQPLFFYAFARAFIRMDRRLWAFLGALVLWVVLVIVDVTQVSLYFVNDTMLSARGLNLLLHTIMWASLNGFIVVLTVKEIRGSASPLHRNRLRYLALAIPFLVAYGGSELILGEPVRPLALGLQIAGVLIVSYATLRHRLVDLRYLIRRSARDLLSTLFALIVYGAAIGITLSLLRGADSLTAIVGALIAASALTFVYQPVDALVQRGMDSILFGRRYDAQSVVQDFSHRLNAQIDLERMAQEGRALMRQAMGAADAVLLLVKGDESGYTLHPLPGRSDGPGTISVPATVSVIHALSERPAPLLQYDIDRLPDYADIPPNVLAAFRNLQGEVYVPVQSRDTLIGIWVIGPKLSGEAYAQADLALLSTLAEQSAVALENARLLSDLREQMRELHSMRDYLDSTLASVTTGVITLDREGRIVSFNRAAEGILRVPAQSAIGQPYDRVLPPLEGAQLPLLLTRLWAQSAQHLVRDVMARVAGRGEVHLTLHLSAVRRGDEMVGVALIVEDLTEQARLELERRAQEEEALRIRDTFEHYVAPRVVEELLAKPQSIALGGVRQVVTILFADIHGFTKLSEQLPPEELVEVLNGYLSLAAQIILRYEGTLDKFMGDGVMAIFDAPLLQTDHAWRAACAALALKREIAAYAPRVPEGQRLTFRVGVHTGEAVVGNIGTYALMNYTAIGDTVNVAKRLQESAEGGQILLSRSTYALIEERVVVLPRPTPTVRGRAAPVEVFELTGAWEEH